MLPRSQMRYWQLSAETTGRQLHYAFLPAEEKKRHACRQHAADLLVGLALDELGSWSSVVIAEMDFAARTRAARCLS